MSLRLDWKPSARRDLARLDPPVRARIVNAVARVAATREGDVVDGLTWETNWTMAFSRIGSLPRAAETALIAASLR